MLPIFAGFQRKNLPIFGRFWPVFGQFRPDFHAVFGGTIR
jgi:hypothetical protein